jgi:large-conductance mechanosensitive channel
MDDGAMIEFLVGIVIGTAVATIVAALLGED